ncbi:MAG TPA: hypothetical protein VIM69_10500 [Opitutaceae bacterium]
MSKRTQKLWQHNSFIGHATMMQKQCAAIYSADTTSATAKSLAKEILRLARELETNLRNERIDK